jgi:hypothetical protein
MKRLILLFLLLIIISPLTSRADSPLTSTPFHEKYTDIDIVLKAEQLGIMNQEFADYLHDRSNPDDVKAALINALGWSTDGKSNAEIYNTLIHKKQITEADISALNANELFVIGYLKALDNYFDVSNAILFLRQARIKNSNSFTYSIIEALAKSQKAMEKDFCKVWKYASKVFSNKDLEIEMREDARKMIYDYMVIYKKDCDRN